MDESTQNTTAVGRLAALIMIGCGFLAVGISFMLLRGTGETAYASEQDFSAVPSQVNYPAPELNLTTLYGESVSLTDYKGSVLLVNLWATWCPPCREEMPTLQAFYEKYKNEGFILIAIDQGEIPEMVVPFVKELGLTFPVWLDMPSEAGRVFGTMNLPSSYVIDRDGQIRLMWIGGISKENLEKYVPKIIKEK